MSASLVGSEMCIRDRPAHHTGSFEHRSQPSVPQPAAGGTGGSLCRKRHHAGLYRPDAHPWVAFAPAGT
eukprot:12017051-Alexandrium_andersonii.AAC.1